MKKITLAMTIVAIFAVAAFGQVEKQVTAIRAEVLKINKGAKSYKKKTANVDGISVEGTEATYFTSGKELKKITAKIYGETFQASAEIYYKGDEMIFCFFKENRYSGHLLVGPKPKLQSVTEERYYFANGELIRMLKGKAEIKPDAEDYAKMRDDMLDTIKKIRDEY